MYSYPCSLIIFYSFLSLRGVFLPLSTCDLSDPSFSESHLYDFSNTFPSFHIDVLFCSSQTDKSSFNSTNITAWQYDGAKAPSASCDGQTSPMCRRRAVRLLRHPGNAGRFTLPPRVVVCRTEAGRLPETVESASLTSTTSRSRSAEESTGGSSPWSSSSSDDDAWTTVT